MKDSIPIERGEPSLCPLSTEFDRPQPVSTLTLCTEYKEDSCCSQSEETELTRQFEELYEYVYSGCTGCYENFRRVVCAMRCSPNQVDFTTIVSEEEGTQIRLCPDSCERFFHSCDNTTARSEAHSVAGEFCLSQDYPFLSTTASPRVVLDQNSCVGVPGPTYCDGGYAGPYQNPNDDDESFTSQQIVLLALICTFVAIVLIAGTVLLCRSVEPGKPEKEIVRAPFLQEKFVVNSRRRSE